MHLGGSDYHWGPFKLLWNDAGSVDFKIHLLALSQTYVYYIIHIFVYIHIYILVRIRIYVSRKVTWPMYTSKKTMPPTAIPRISHSLVDVLSQRLQNYLTQIHVRVTAAALLVCEHAKDSQPPLSPSMSKRPIPRSDKQVVHVQLIVPCCVHLLRFISILRLGRLSESFPTWQILRSFANAWATCPLWDRCASYVDKNMHVHVVWTRTSLLTHFDWNKWSGLMLRLIK